MRDDREQPNLTEEEKKLMAGDGYDDNSELKEISIPEDMCPVRLISVLADDGTTATASYRIPPGKGPFPAIVIIHGGLNHRSDESRHANITGNIVLTSLLAEGYVVVQSTFRTYHENPQDEGPILDNLAILDYVRKMDKVDPESVVMLGGSGGGSIILDLLSRTKICAAVAGEPASIIFAGLLTAPAASREVRYEPINEPDKFFTPEKQQFLRYKISRFSSPLMIVHGDIHPIKEFNMKYLIPEIQKAGKSLEVKVYPGKAHGFYFGKNVSSDFVESFLEDINTFYKKYLKTQPVPFEY